MAKVIRKAEYDFLTGRKRFDGIYADNRGICKDETYLDDRTRAALNDDELFELDSTPVGHKDGQPLLLFPCTYNELCTLLNFYGISDAIKEIVRWSEIPTAGIFGFEAEQLLDLAVEGKIKALFYCSPSNFRVIERDNFGGAPEVVFNAAKSLDAIRHVDPLLGDGYAVMLPIFLREILEQGEYEASTGKTVDTELSVWFSKPFAVRRDKLIFLLEEISTIAANSKEFVTSSAPAKFVSTTRQQEEIILKAIRDAGHVPKNLPPRVAGKSGLKAVVWKMVERSFHSDTVFKKAWQRLRDSKEILETQ